jgi:hypothetical protein
MKSLKNIAACLLLLTSPFALAGTELILQSEPGDYIGQGKNYRYTDAEAKFTYSRNFDNGISVNINTGSTWWSMDLAAAGNEQLKAGVYTNAERFPFNSINRPGFNFSGDGRGCNRLAANFLINEVTYGADGTLLSLDAMFEQFCESNTAALRGHIKYSLYPPVGVTTTGMKTLKASCLNKTTGQKIVFKTPTANVDCRKQGLVIQKADSIAITIYGDAE